MSVEHKLVPFDYRQMTPEAHAKKLNRSLCIPSIMQSYNMATQFVRYWFLSQFHPNPFKNVYIEGKNIMDEFRSVKKLDLIKRPKPSLAIIPSIDLGYNNDNLDLVPFGINTYAPRGMFKDSFFKDPTNQIYLGIAMQTILMNFNIKVRVETKGQQTDMFKYIQIAHRIGTMHSEDVDIDFHIPYSLMLQIAEDAGFHIILNEDQTMYPKIEDIHAFLSYLNGHSAIPFLYKFRAENGKNEFFLRMERMAVNINPSDLSPDDGEREGHNLNNFQIDFNVELHFPAPQLYAYYSSHEHKIKTVYGAFNQATGIVTSICCFKGTEVPPTNSRGWPLWMHTTYEDTPDKINQILQIDFMELFSGDLYIYVQDCLKQGMSPAIFCDFIMVNSGEKVFGKMDWDTMIFTSAHPVRSYGTFIGVYLDTEYINNYIACTRGATDNRLQISQHPAAYQQRPDGECSRDGEIPHKVQDIMDNR